jgi:hypothetical protein
MNGPEEPGAKHALYAAKRDRREKARPKRAVSGATSKSVKLSDSVDTASTKDASSTDKDLKTSETSAATTLDTDVTSSSAAKSLDEKTHEEKPTGEKADVSKASETNPSGTTTTNAPNTKQGQARKTSGEGKGNGTTRRKRWWRRNRNTSGNQGKDQENKSQQKAATGNAQPTEKSNGAAVKDGHDKPLDPTTNAAATVAA